MWNIHSEWKRKYSFHDLELTICLDDWKVYSRRCVDVSHNRNYHLFTNQDSPYLYKPGKIDLDQIIQQLQTNFLVPSEFFEDKLYSVNMVSGICECVRGCFKGPCKHKKAEWTILKCYQKRMKLWEHFTTSLLLEFEGNPNGLDH